MDTTKKSKNQLKVEELADKLHQLIKDEKWFCCMSIARGQLKKNWSVQIIFDGSYSWSESVEKFFYDLKQTERDLNRFKIFGFNNLNMIEFRNY